jgi:hypothetical protein
MTYTERLRSAIDGLHRCEAVNLRRSQRKTDVLAVPR